MRFLVLDDNPDDRALAVRALEHGFPGARVRPVATPEDFDAALDAGPYDAAVTDYQLRWTDGIRVLETLIARFPDLPVVMFTSSGNEEVCADAMKRGLSDYVLKRHGHFQRLAHAVRGALDRRELRGRVEQLLAKEKEAREAADRANRLKEEFLATLSHELRTPLHAVLGWTTLLKQGALPEADRKRAVEVIERNARAQATLIEDILDFSRLQSGKLHLEPEEVDLAPVVASALAAVQPMAQPKRIALRPEIAESGATVKGSAGRLRQMVLNLLTNAIKFSPDGTEVRVALRARHGSAFIEVADQGVGITAEFLPHVFDPFRQADASLTRRAGGMGIGLGLVKKLAEAHEGTVEAASAGPGQGATFTIRLPLSTADRTVAHAPALDREHPPSLKGVTVLAVDDEQDGLQYLERVLRHCGAQVRTTAHPEQVPREVAAQRPIVLVCDIGMPGMDGYEVIRQVRSLPDAAARATPAIALTAFASSEDRERALLAGFQGFLAKPVDSYELIVQVASLAGVLDRASRCAIED